MVEKVSRSNVLSISHWKDLDGIASAAIIGRYADRTRRGFKVYLTEPYLFHSVLIRILKSGVSGSEIIISDIGPNNRIFGKAISLLAAIKERGNTIIWIDHHLWSEDQISSARNVVNELIIDTSKCAAMLVYERFGEGDEFSKRLAELATDADFWIRKIDLSIKLCKVLASGYNRERLISKFREGILWDSELESVYSRRVEREKVLLEKAIKKLREYKVDNLRIAVILAEISAGEITEILAERGYDIIAVVSKKGHVSLRRGNNKIDLVPIALRLGGGGHPFAAGGSLEYNFFDKMLARLGYYRKISRLLKAVKEGLEEQCSCR